MKPRNLFLLILVIVGALAFGSNAFAADLTYTNSGVLEYWADDVNDTSLVNTITVEPGETPGFQNWVKITYDWWNTGPVYGDASLTNNCIQENAFWACPASKVWVRTSKGDDSITVKPGVTAWVLAEGGAGSDTITGGNEKDEFWGACKFAPADQCYGFSDALNGGGGDDFLVGGSTTPVFGLAADTLHGGPGDDSLEGGYGPDQLWGDSGNDTVTYGFHPGPVTASLDDTANDGQAGENDYIHSDVEGIAGTANKDNLYGNDGDNVLKGGPGDDNLLGFGGSDKLYGEDGSDLLRPGLGADFLYGGGDGNSCCWNDTVSYSERGGPVNASIDGNANDGEPGEGDYIDDDVESLAGGNNNDVLIGNGRGNTLTGNGGQDTLIGLGSPLPQNPAVGTTVADTLNGGAGDDTLNGGPQGSMGDTIDGGAGTDTVNYASRTDDLQIFLDKKVGQGEDDIAWVENIISGDGNDTIVADNGPNVVYAGDGNDGVDGEASADIVHGGDGNDTLWGGNYNDTLLGENGNDKLVGGSGSDVMSGNAGIDTADYSNETERVTVTLNGLADDGIEGDDDNVTPDTENIIGGSGNDTLTGSAGPNTINGGPGKDLIHGGSENDAIFGGPDPDQLYGDDGLDTFVGGPGSDKIWGGGGVDFVDYQSSTAPVTVNLKSHKGTSKSDGSDKLQEIENAYGSPFDDKLTGDLSNNTLMGFEGNDTIDGGGGNDHLFGANGDDWIRGGLGDDEVNGGNGTDTADFAKASAGETIDLSFFNAFAKGGDGNDWLSFTENITGSGKDDTITGSTDPNVIKGGSGADKIYVLGGDDTLNGDGGADTVDGGLNTDTCVAEAKANCEK
jgi:Ca2+-binding RTX toxin-like protein